MDIFITTILTFLVVYYLVYEIIIYVTRESIQFIKNEVKYNYEELNNQTNNINQEDLIAKLASLQTNVVNINNEIKSQQNILKTLQDQLNNI
jgi:predicted Holliday junction resolvase-like endonuclease